MAQAKWIWYPGSFELYHGMLLLNRRTSSKTYRYKKKRLLLSYVES